MSTLRYATSFRLLKIRQAFIEGKRVEDVYRLTKIDPWFLYQIKQITEFSKEDELLNLKQSGFSDAQIGRLYNKTELEIRDERKKRSIYPAFKVVDTCAAEFVAETPYCYSTYEVENEIEPLQGKKIIILGGGPNRIGQGLSLIHI